MRCLAIASAVLLIPVLVAPAAVVAAELGGTVFHDKNGDGLRDPGEAGLVTTVELFGRGDSRGPLDSTFVTGVDGRFFIGAADVDDGCYATRVTPPPGFRFGQPNRGCPGAGLAAPVGTRRYGAPQHLIDALRMGALTHVGLGDSIAEPASLCTIFPLDNTDYLKWLKDRLECTGVAVDHRNEAIGGKLSHDLLLPAGSCQWPLVQDPLQQEDQRCNNVYDAVAMNPELITISIGGNDWLGAEPDESAQSEPFDPIDLQRSVEALLSARANLQETLAMLATELPTSDVVVNTVYDNWASSCASTAFHNIWIPVWNQMLRDGVWGHGDRFQVAEIYPEYAHQDLNGGNCCGQRDRICGDRVHPNRDGALMHLEKVFDAAGLVNLGPRDGIAATTNLDLNFPMLELVTVREPSVVTDRTAGTTSPDAVLVADNAGAEVVAGDGELVVSGFDAAPDGVDILKVVVAVRYHTRADQPQPGADPLDGHYFEASTDGGFLPPQYTVTGWNTVVPIVGAGATAPQPNALPDVPAWREVRATLTKNLLDDGRARGYYEFPALDWNDVATLAVRLRWADAGNPDPERYVVWDAVWLEIYGCRRVPQDFNVYRATSPVNLIDPGNFLAFAPSGPYDDLAVPSDPLLFYAVDDGAGNPAVIRMTGDLADVRIHW